jgi:hypothetical protein
MQRREFLALPGGASLSSTVDGELMSNALLAEDVRRGWITPALGPSYVPGPKVHVAPFDDVMRELRADRDWG